METGTVDQWLDWHHLRMTSRSTHETRWRSSRSASLSRNDFKVQEVRIGGAGGDMPRVRQWPRKAGGRRHSDEAQPC